MRWELGLETHDPSVLHDPHPTRRTCRTYNIITLPLPLHSLPSLCIHSHLDLLTSTL